MRRTTRERTIQAIAEALCAFSGERSIQSYQKQATALLGAAEMQDALFASGQDSHLIVGEGYIADHFVGNPSCPQCGLPMVQRRSQRGPFWGCPSYPDCRGLIPIDRD